MSAKSHALRFVPEAYLTTNSPHDAGQSLEETASDEDRLIILSRFVRVDLKDGIEGSSDHFHTQRWVGSGKELD